MSDFLIDPGAFQTVDNARAMQLFKSDPDAAMRGHCFSAESGASEADDGLAELALTEPERFMELLGHLPYLAQDAFLLYYLVGYTQQRIADVFGISQARVFWILNLGTKAICAIIAAGGLPEPSSPMAGWYEEVFKMRPIARKARDRTSRALGSFELSPNDLTECLC